MEKRFKLNLRDYTAKQNGKELLNTEGKPVIYQVKASISTVLFAPRLQLGMRDVIRNDAIAKNIETAKDDVLLTEEEAQIIKEAFRVFVGFGRLDIELINRIETMEEVDVKVKEIKE